jgi:hypothetical protein
LVGEILALFLGGEDASPDIVRDNDRLADGKGEGWGFSYSAVD